MTHSMTAYASVTGTAGTTSWVWEMRGVNARGLDVRLRIPDGLGGVEAYARRTLAKSMARGNVTLSLRLTQADSTTKMRVDTDQLDCVLAALDQVQNRAFDLGVTLGQPTAADVLAQRGVLVATQENSDNDNIINALIADIDVLVDAFVTMRKAEGTALATVISGQIAQITDLTAQATDALVQRAADQSQALRASMDRVLQDVGTTDPDRLAQELAVLAVKSDITEELDRLRAHSQAAQDILSGGGPCGRKLDFLTQEFMREANTLCSKAGAPALTAIGLELKAVIDQMREQIQNVE